MESSSPDAEALADRVFQATLGAFDILSIHIGDRLGYYPALRKDGPLTASQLAKATGTDPRLTREWLEQQAVTLILEVRDADADPDERLFSLPAEHAEVLCDELGPLYLAPMARMTAASATRMPLLLEAFRTGDGLSWSAGGPDLRESQADINRPLYLNELAGQLASIPDLRARLEAPGARVADVGCGAGWSTIGLASAFPALRADGFDLDAPAIEMATANARAAGLSDRVAFHAVNAASPEVEAPYDLVIACECIHDMPDPVSVLGSMRKLAGEDGAVIVIDERVAERFGELGDDLERVMYGYSILVCLPDGMSSKPSVATGTIMRPDTLRGYAREAGFEDIEILPIEHESFRYYRLV